MLKQWEALSGSLVSMAIPCRKPGDNFNLPKVALESDVYCKVFAFEGHRKTLASQGV